MPLAATRYRSEDRLDNRKIRRKERMSLGNDIVLCPLCDGKVGHLKTKISLLRWIIYDV